jgi:hypothetical protein
MAMKVEEAAQLVKNMREEFEEELEHVEVTLREEFVSVQVRPRRARLRGKHVWPLPFYPDRLFHPDPPSKVEWPAGG